jgi:hypothetical protein
LGALFVSRYVRQYVFVETILLILGLGTGSLLCFYWEPIAQIVTENGDGAAISVFEGVSVWPTILLRAIGVVLSSYFIYRVLNGLDKNLRVIAEKMELRPEPETMRHQLLGIQEILNFRSWLRSLFNPSRKHNRSAQNGFVNVQDVWQAYVVRERIGRRCFRAYLFTCGMYLFGKYVLVPMLGKPMIPVRGHDLAFDWYMWTIWGNVLLISCSF